MLVSTSICIYIYIHFPKPTPTSLVEQRRAQTTRLDVLGQNLRRLDSRDLDEVLSPDQSAVRGEANVLARPQKPPCLPGDVATALPLPRLVRSRANRLVLFFLCVVALRWVVFVSLAWSRCAGRCLSCAVALRRTLSLRFFLLGCVVLLLFLLLAFSHTYHRDTH